MAFKSGSGGKSPDHDDHATDPSMSKGTLLPIGTYVELKDEAVSVNQKSGHHGPGSGAGV